MDFNPRSPWRERQYPGCLSFFAKSFQSTLPVKGATWELRKEVIDIIFQSTLPVKGATGWIRKPKRPATFQSTLPVKGATLTSRYISYIARAFQSTLPVKGATVADFNSFPPFSNFNPRSPWRERRLSISLPGSPRPISIHAPREGSDDLVQILKNAFCHFNPRSPWRERHSFVNVFRICSKFQSTLPVKGATRIKIIFFLGNLFQSTLPVKGATAMLTNFSVTIVQLSANSTNFSL